MKDFIKSLDINKDGTIDRNEFLQQSPHGDLFDSKTPHQIHISMTNNPDEMVIMWVTDGMVLRSFVFAYVTLLAITNSFPKITPHRLFDMVNKATTIRRVLQERFGLMMWVFLEVPLRCLPSASPHIRLSQAGISGFIMCSSQISKLVIKCIPTNVVTAPLGVTVLILAFSSHLFITPNNKQPKQSLIFVHPPQSHERRALHSSPIRALISLLDLL